MSKRATDAAWVLYPDHPSMDGGYVSQRKQRGLVMQGYEQAEKDLGWHPASELPAIDEEVIVLMDVRSEVAVEPLYRIAFAHRVNPKYCEAYDTGGWNIPGVCWWMPMPKLPKE